MITKEELHKINQERHDEEVARRILNESFGVMCWKCKVESKPITPPCVYCNGCRQLIADGKIKGVI
jgi:hypothetical protein